MSQLCRWESWRMDGRASSRSTTCRDVSVVHSQITQQTSFSCIFNVLNRVDDVADELEQKEAADLLAQYQTTLGETATDALEDNDDSLVSVCDSHCCMYM